MKLIPLFATNAMEDNPLPPLKSSLNRREWIMPRPQRRRRPDPPQGPDRLRPTTSHRRREAVEEITEVILGTIGKPDSLKSYVPDRPGHGPPLRRRLLQDYVGARLGADHPFERGIRETVLWYRDNPEW